jgi:hypothetical protein
VAKRPGRSAEDRDVPIAIRMPRQPLNLLANVCPDGIGEFTAYPMARA